VQGVFRYVKTVKRTYGPTHIITAVDEQHRILDCMTDGEGYSSARSVWYIRSRRKGARFTGVETPTRLHPDDWWRYVADSAKCGYRLYIVVPNAGDFCTTTGFWRWCDMGVFSFGGGGDSGGNADVPSSGRHAGWTGRLVLGGPPDIITVRTANGTVSIVSSRNYSEASWGQLASSVRYTLPEGGTSTDPAHDTAYDVWDKCVILSRYIRALIGQWIGRDCGPWKDTAAQLSVTLWRKRFYTQKVCRHDNATANKLEREAAHGGRNEVWFYGDIGDRRTIPDGCEAIPTESKYPPIQGAVYRCDVTSQYPSLLAEEHFPIRLRGTTNSVSVADLQALLTYYEVIARVELYAERPEYPSKRNGIPHYGCGRVVTTIASPELRTAIERGELRSVLSCAYYERGAPLRDYARYLLAERERSRRENDYVAECFAKSLATSIGGKFSQRATRREPCYGVVSPFDGWGPFTRIGKDGTPESYVSIAGVCYKTVEVTGGSRLLAALYCQLTSYGRVQMMRYREALGRELPYAQCTDGIWVGERGRATLQRLGLSGNRIPGTLREVSQHTFARWITPNHYYIDGRWTLSGYKHGCVIGSDLVVTEFRDKNPVRTVPYKAPMAIKRECVKRNLAESSSQATIGEDGWIIPSVSR
jgi:hypothetical protein